MKKIQALLPIPLEKDLRQIAATLDTSMADLLRRGAEYVRECHRHTLTNNPKKQWTRPKPSPMGKFLSDASKWREIANERSED